MCIMANQYSYDAFITEKEVFDLYHVKIMTIAEIARKFNVSDKRVYTAVKKLGIPLRKNKKRDFIKRVEGRYKGEKVFDKKVAKHTNFKDREYIMVYAPEYKCANKSGYVSEHKLNVLKNLHIEDLPKGTCIHHINMNKSNNRVENLQVCNKSDHAKYHSRLNDIICDLFQKEILGFDTEIGYFIKDGES